MKIIHPLISHHLEVKDVFVGGCVIRGEGSRFRAKAHSHINDSYKGWICYLSSKWLHVPEIALHELAHILTGHGHTDKWRKKLLEIGGTLQAVPGVLGNCEKRKRTVSV